MKLAFVIFIALVIAASGCIGQIPQQPDSKAVHKDGVDYVFSNALGDIRKVPVKGEDEIVQELLKAEKINIAFVEETEDNAVFAKVAFDLTGKLVHYYAYTQGRFIEVKGVPFSNRTEVSGLPIVLAGPHTEANENSVSIINGVIFVQGLDNSALSLAADRLALLLLEKG